MTMLYLLALFAKKVKISFFNFITLLFLKIFLANPSFLVIILNLKFLFKIFCKFFILL